MSILKPMPRTSFDSGKWLKCYAPKPAAKFKLICFPFAGGGANAYRRWESLFARDIEVSAVLLPGRETRMKEANISNAGTVCDAVIEDLVSSSWKKSLVFFGHSMGSALALEVAWRLKNKYDWEPEVVFVSGRKPPHVQFGGDYHKAPEEIFIQELKRLNGTPDAVFDDQEMRRIILPMLRSDYAILETYRLPAGLRLNCPIVTCVSDQDPDVTPEAMHAWAELTRGRCEHKVFRGGHFYINDRAPELVRFIGNYLSDCF